MTEYGDHKRTDTVYTVNGVEVRFMGDASTFIEIENPLWKSQGGRPVGAHKDTWLEIAHLIIEVTGQT